MRYGVFSDVHGNYEALAAVLDFFDRNFAEAYIFCGDLVGYGPQPQECVDVVSRLPGLRAVMGNHDGALTGKIELRWFNANAAAAIEYAKLKLTGQARAFLADLPERVDDADFTLVHGSPRKPLTEYLLNGNQFSDNAGLWNTSPCFIGHSHMPMFFREREGAPVETDFLKPMRRLPAAGGRTMFNPGSVGQPRDGDPRASCALYDTETGTFEVFRVFYDVGATQKRMKAAGLPDALAERLSFGY